MGKEKNNKVSFCKEAVVNGQYKISLWFVFLLKSQEIPSHIVLSDALV